MQRIDLCVLNRKLGLGQAEWGSTANWKLTNWAPLSSSVLKRRYVSLQNEWIKSVQLGRGRPKFGFGFGFGAESWQMAYFGIVSVSAEGKKLPFGFLSVSAETGIDLRSSAEGLL